MRSALGQPLREISHNVEISVASGIATYKVRRVFENGGQTADEARLAIDLPYGAAATGLRIRARDRWYDGALMEKERAAQLYKALTGLGTLAPKDPALLQWLWADKLYLQVFPVLPGATSSVEYTLTVPTRYEHGHVLLAYPRGPAPAASDPAAADEGVNAHAYEEASLPLRQPVVTLRPAWGDATTRVLIDGQRAAPDTPIVLPAAPRLSTWAPDAKEPTHASYVASSIELPAAERPLPSFDTAQLTLTVEHPYRGDLQVELLTPGGERLPVFSGEESETGTSNDVRETFAVELPEGTPAVGMWRLIVSDHGRLDTGTLAEWTLKLGAGPKAIEAHSLDTPIFIPDAAEHTVDVEVATLELAGPPMRVLAARLGKVVASPDKAFSRLEIDVAPQLIPLPKKPQLVFVLDASHSQGTEGIAAQLALVAAYLSHVPDARLELVLYRRHAWPLFGDFIAATSFAERIASARNQGLLEPGNGSNLEEGARQAATLLARRPGPLRMVITTDALLRPNFRNEHALKALTKLPGRGVVHVVLAPRTDSEHVMLARDDQHPLAVLAAAHHGIFAEVEPDLSGEKTLARATVGLVRPIQIDDVQVKGLSAAQDGVEGPLREGESVRAMNALASAPDALVITGKIWGDAFRHVVRAEERFSRAMAGWIFAEDGHEALSKEEMLRVARWGHAVSPMTSYLATGPGVRPSSSDLPEGGRGPVGRIGRGSGSGEGAGYDHDLPDLRALVWHETAQCLARHAHAAAWSLTLVVDTTYTEVVDVTPVPSALEKSDLQTCLVEALWTVRLDSRFDSERDRFELTFP